LSARVALTRIRPGEMYKSAGDTRTDATPVRVAHVVHALMPGGAERRMLAILGSLDRGRFEPLLICLDGLGPLAEEACALGVEPVVIRRRGKVDPPTVARLARFLRQQSVTIVQGWLPLPAAFARIAGTVARVPARVFSVGTSVFATDPHRARAFALLERALQPLTEMYLANSEAVAWTLRGHGVPEAKIAVIHNGVAVPALLSEVERARLRAELGAAPDDFLVGTVARLDPETKDFTTLVRAVAALAGDGVPVRAVVVGDGPAREDIQRESEKHGISDRLNLTGYRRDADRLIGSFDVSVLLSYTEGFSNSVLESMAAGIPVVATAIPPNAEALHDGVHGFLVAVGDVSATTAGLRRLAEASDLGARLGAAGRQRISERFSLARQAEGVTRLYEALVGDAGRRPRATRPLG
jgi:glycosyltransferase involved in cell wall biosynthesis